MGLWATVGGCLLGGCDESSTSEAGDAGTEEAGPGGDGSAGEGSGGDAKKGPLVLVTERGSGVQNCPVVLNITERPGRCTPKKSNTLALVRLSTSPVNVRWMDSPSIA